MAGTRKSTLISFIALTIVFGVAATRLAADSSNHVALPVLPVVVVTPDGGQPSPTAARSTPRFEVATVAPETASVHEIGPVLPPRERIADGRRLPRLPTVEVSARVAPETSTTVFATTAPTARAAHAPNEGRVGNARAGSVRLTMPYYAFGGRSESTQD